MQDKQTAVINTAVIVIGSYHLPASVAIGALVGASLFILGRQGYPLISKAWLFAVSYFFGIFAGDDAAELLTAILPSTSKPTISPAPSSPPPSPFLLSNAATHGLPTACRPHRKRSKA